MSNKKSQKKRSVKISKEMAATVADSMASLAYKEAITNAMKNRDEVVRKLIEKKIPAPVREFVEKNAAYFKMRGIIYVRCPGYKSRDCYVQQATPYNDLVVSIDEMNEVCDEYKKVNDLTGKRYELQMQIKEQLLRLGTTKRVDEQFPEATPFFANIGDEIKEEEETLNCVRKNFKSKMSDK